MTCFMSLSISPYDTYVYLGRNGMVLSVFVLFDPIKHYVLFLIIDMFWELWKIIIILMRVYMDMSVMRWDGWDGMVSCVVFVLVFSVSCGCTGGIGAVHGRYLCACFVSLFRVLTWML